jgi:DNA-binding NarL/FixJ family response regulator
VLESEALAIEWIRSNPLDDLDCALVDLFVSSETQNQTLNSMIGLRIVKELRQCTNFKGTILVLANSRMLDEGERAYQAGCDGYLFKRNSMEEIPSMVAELRMAMIGNVLLVPREMRHLFIHEQLSPKEARLMELVNQGCSWSEIAHELGYKSANAAATVGYRVFDKILDAFEDYSTNNDGNKEKKRVRALERWRARMRREPVKTVAKTDW